MLPSSVLIVAAWLAVAPQQVDRQPALAAPPIAVDIVAVPSNVLPAPDEVSVSIDGRSRKVISIRPILRGPGSERALFDTQPGAISPVTELSRTIIVAVDQSTLARGSEKKVSAMMTRVLDLIAPDDQAALIPLPLERSGVVAVSTDRRAMWSTLGKIRVGASAAPLALARPEQPPQLPDEETPEIRSPSSETRPSTERNRQPLPLRSEPRRADLERAPGPLDDMRGLLAAITRIPGSKTVLVIRGTEAPDPESDPETPTAARLDSTGLLQAAAGARAIIHVVTLGERWRGNVDEVARLARMTGGDEFRLGKRADREVERLGGRMSEGLRIAVESAPTDLDGRTHAVTIAMSRRDVTVLAPERWLPFEAREPEPIAAALAPRTRESPNPMSPRNTAHVDPELQRVVARMSAYVAQYVENFTAVVAEESYKQSLVMQAWLRPVSRELRSDFLLVRIPGQDDWTPFRDVFQVDGKPVRDRDDRLRKLFIEMPPDAMDRARRILDEGARYNIGKTYRNINMPVLPLVFLMPKFIGGLQFRRVGEDTIEGVRTWEIAFDELGRPTAIRNDRENRDIPANGSFWVDPATGRILKTRIRVQDSTVRMDTTVLYRRSETLQLWAPAEMSEVYISGAERLTGAAKYKNFRQFRVEVEEKIAVPKG